MSLGIQLSKYSASPLYNIKAVVQATSISPSTLRAWERRYQVCTPQRTSSGYRLYSDRDVAVIRWLKLQVDAGVSISQAVSWYESLVTAADTFDDVVLPLPKQDKHSLSERSGLARERTATRSTAIRDFEGLQNSLLNSLLEYDEVSAEDVISEALSFYTLEDVGDRLLTPVMATVGEQWHRGELNITKEHYITGYLRQRLAAILRAVPDQASGPTIWIGCAPNEQHEVGALLLSIYLRRAGFRVRYFGQNLQIDDFAIEVQKNRPDMVMLSATTVDAAYDLRELTNRLAALNLQQVVVGYGGQVFERQPELRNKIVGVYLGNTAQDAVETTTELLNGSG